MEFKQAAKTRRSIRRFEDREIPREVFEEIVESARFAPSWKNVQPARYIIVADPAKRAELAQPECVFNFTFNLATLESARAIVLLTYVKGRSGYERDGSFSTPKGAFWEAFDAGIAAQTFCLAAHNKGIGTVILGYFDEEAIRKAVAIPEEQAIGAVIACGYPAESPAAPKRKEVGELMEMI